MNKYIILGLKLIFFVTLWSVLILWFIRSFGFGWKMDFFLRFVVSFMMGHAANQSVILIKKNKI